MFITRMKVNDIIIQVRMSCLSTSRIPLMFLSSLVSHTIFNANVKRRSRTANWSDTLEPIAHQPIVGRAVWRVATSLLVTIALLPCTDLSDLLLIFALFYDKSYASYYFIGMYKDDTEIYIYILFIYCIYIYI